MSDFELYDKFKKLYDANNLTALMSESMKVLMDYGVLLLDKVIAVEAGTDSERYAEDEYEHFIVVSLFTEHLLKVVLRIGEKGTVYRYIEPAINCGD